MSSDRRIEYMPLTKLQPAKKNPKLHALESIRASFSEHGFVEPLIMDERTGRLVAGHGRRKQLLALVKDGRQPPDGIKVDESGDWLVPVGRGWGSRDDQEAEGYLLTSNQLTILGGWDLAELVPMLKEQLEHHANLEAIGWSAGDIGAMVAKLEQAPRPLAPTMRDKFLVPPFSVLDARQGYWQDRKRAWLAIGIQSEIGRGANLLKMSDTALEPDPIKRAEMRKRQGINRAPMSASFGQDLMRDDYQAKKRPNGHLEPGAQRALGAYFSDGGSIDRNTGGQTGTSIFDPVLCELLYRWFCPAEGEVLDPFAGGSVRGIVASKLGYGYTGIDLREEQVDANDAQGKQLCEADNKPRWICGDAQNLEKMVGPGGAFDMVLTCPPYADLERYSDDPRDLSVMKWEDFVRAYRKILAAAAHRLKSDRFAAIVIGDVRDPKGLYRDLPGVTIGAMRDVGLALYNDAILVTSVGSLPIRAGKIFSASRKLGTTHQRVLIFAKGDPVKAAKACGQVEVSFPEEIAREDEAARPAEHQGMVEVKVSAKNARLLFNGCDPAYIATTCHASCCESSTSPSGIVVAIHPTERAAIEARGGKIDEGGLLQPREGEHLCPFKNPDSSLCGLHGTHDKPFGCRALPFTLNANGTLIVRNRYKLLRCYDDGKRQPAYEAFRASLDLLFGQEEAARICAHLDAGGGDLTAWMAPDKASCLRFKDEASNAKTREAAAAAGAMAIAREENKKNFAIEAKAPAWAKGYPMELLRERAAIFKAHDKPFVLGAFGGVKENQIAEWMAKDCLRELRAGQRNQLAALAVVRKQKAEAPILDFSGAVIGTALPGDLMIKRIAGDVQLLLCAAEYSAPRAWLEIWQEHEASRKAAEQASFRWAGTKISAASELIGVWARGIEVQAPSEIEQAALARLALPPEPLRLAAEALQRAIEREAPAWADHYSSYNKRKSWSALALRGYGAAEFIEKPAEMSKKWKEEHPAEMAWTLRDTPLRAQLLEAEPLIEMIPGIKHRIRLMRLAKGQGELTRHADITDPDAGVADGRLMRIHIPIQTNPEVAFKQWLLNGSTIAGNFGVAHAFYLDTRKPHTAVNNGATDRIHLVLDVESCAALRALVLG